MRVNKTISDCTIYAFTGTAILAISLVVAMYVGNDFQQSLFVDYRKQCLSLDNIPLYG